MNQSLLDLSLEARERCAQTGGKLQCAGHWDHWGDAMVWTKHFSKLGMAYKVVPYDHVAPEVIEACRPK